ncbi:MAG: YidC/Oxa1 family membrane protein insertase [Christensenellaceae bacterium]|nr:YidC/Oxa1 family membrane protein insertase [Christensenellaceae bacterium]
MSIIITPLRAIIDFIYGLVGNYSVAIILFTLVIKLVLSPLDFKQRSSSRKMAALNDKIQEINKKYDKDPEKKNMKTMELYKKEGVNPLSGCLPMLIQLPIIFAMFAVLRHIADEQAVSMFLTAFNGGSFIPESFLWVHNIWQPDNIMAPIIPLLETVQVIRPIAGNPIVTEANLALMAANYETVMKPLFDVYNTGTANGWAILPLAAGASQFFMAKFTTPPPPQQQPKKAGAPDMSKMMLYMMPLMSVFFCWQYNAAFAVYWATSSLYSIGLYYASNFFAKLKEGKSTSPATLSDSEGKRK